MSNDTVQFKCHHCNHCCTDVVCLPSPWDVRRITRMTGLDPFEFLEFLTPDEIEDIDPDDPTWLVVDGQKYLMALQRDDVLGCHFLDKKTRLCKVYEARPLLCRLYPFKAIEAPDGSYGSFTLHQDVGCPRHQDGLVPTRPLWDLYCQDEINQEDYAELVEVFNAMEYPGKEVEDFVVMFTGGISKLHKNLADQSAASDQEEAV